jgi:hypothetical protein
MLDIAKMITNLRDVTGESNTTEELDDITALTYLNKSYWKILDEFEFRQKELTVFFNTIAGTETYGLPVLYEAVQHIAIVNENDVRVPLIQKTRLYFDQDYSTNIDNQAIPTHYIREGNNIRLQPIPDAEYRIHLNYLTTLSDLAADNTTPTIPRAWHEIIELGAKYRRLFDLGDREGGILFKQLYDREISTLKPVKAKETTNMQTAGLEVLGREY